MYKKITHHIVEEHYDHPAALEMMGMTGNTVVVHAANTTPGHAVLHAANVAPVHVANTTPVHTVLHTGNTVPHTILHESAPPL